MPRWISELAYESYTLLSQIRLALLDGANDHVANASRRHTVKSRTEALDGNDVQVLGARVVSAVDHSAHW